MARKANAEATEVKETVAEATEVAEVKEEAKVYKFKSENAFLTVSALGVQFMNGVATTTNLAVARALVKIDGVEMVEE